MNFKILIIHKPAEWIEAFEAQAEKKQWQVVVCPSGLTGIVKAQELSPDVVIIGDEVEGCSPMIAIRNMSGAPVRKRFVMCFMGSKDFFFKHDREIKKLMTPLRLFMQKPVDLKELESLIADVQASEEESKIVDKYKDMFFAKPEVKVPKAPVAKTPEKKPEPKKAVPQKVPKKEEPKSVAPPAEPQKELKKVEKKKEGPSAEQLNRALSRAKALEEKYQSLVTQVEQLKDEKDELRLRNEKGDRRREQEYQAKVDQVVLLQRKAEDLHRKGEELKERVKKDLHQIRAKERELETRIEILKRDSEALLIAKDRKLLEFKRRIDALEYDKDNLMEREKDAVKTVDFWKSRMERVLRALKMGTSLLETEAEIKYELEEEKKVFKKTSKVA